jgi:hypothetical protein
VCTLRTLLDTPQLLLDHGVFVNCSSTEGRTPLHVAAAQGNVETLQLLLRCGASINRETNTGELWGLKQMLADASVLSDACRSAAAASRIDNVALLLKQLGLVDPAAMQRVVRRLRQPHDAAEACIARWIAETKSMDDQQQRLDAQQRQAVAQWLAAQQLVVAVAGMQLQVAAERQAVQQLVVAAADMQRQAAAERQASRQHAADARRRGSCWCWRVAAACGDDSSRIAAAGMAYAGQPIADTDCVRQQAALRMCLCV